MTALLFERTRRPFAEASRLFLRVVGDALNRTKRKRDGFARFLARLQDSEPAQRRPSVGKVTFVGAGPGDVDLLTLKAARAIRSAETILYDALVRP